MLSSASGKIPCGKQGENRVGFPCKKRKSDAEDSLIQDIDPSGLFGEIDRKNKVFDTVDQQNGHYGKTAQSIARFDLRCLGQKSGWHGKSVWVSRRKIGKTAGL